MPMETLDNMDEVNHSIIESHAKKVSMAINKLMTLRMPQWKFGFETGLSFSPIGDTKIPGYPGYGGFGCLFDFNYDKNTFEVLHPKWEPLGDKPIEYTGEVEKKEENVSAIMNTDGEEFTF